MTKKQAEPLAWGKWVAWVGAMGLVSTCAVQAQGLAQPSTSTDESAESSMQDVHVSGTRQKKVGRHDITPAVSGHLISANDLRYLPLDSSISGIAMTAPSAIAGDSAFGKGKLPSLGGASVGENAYYIDDFDVTNIRNFLSYVTLPAEAIAEEEVQTSGWSAKYGRALGGLVHVRTRAGSDVWKGGASLAIEPRALRAQARDVRSRTAGSALDYTLYQSRDRSSAATAVAYMGGPLIEKELYFFGMVQGSQSRADDFEAATNVHSRTTEPSSLIRLDWRPHVGHRVQWTGIQTRTTTHYTDYSNAQLYSPGFDGAGQASRSVGGSSVSILKYTGTLTDQLSVALTVGQADYQLDRLTGARMKEGCPTVYETDDRPIGCWSKVGSYAPTLRDPLAPEDTDRRRAWRFDVNYQTATGHQWRAGIDFEKFRSRAAGQVEYGGAYYGYNVSQDGSIDGVPGVVAPGTPYVLKYVKASSSGAYSVKNRAWYVEDDWKLSEDFSLYGGLRADFFDNQDAYGRSFVKATRLLAPRLGFSWFPEGANTNTRIFGSVGRHHIPVSSSANIRLTRSEIEGGGYYTYTGRDPVTQAPLNTRLIGEATVVRDGRVPDPATVASLSLKPMAQDEFMLGFERALAKGWSVNVKGVYRVIRHGVDDFCSSYPMVNWAADNGYRKFDPQTLPGCILVNPGRDVTLKMDVDHSGQLKSVTIPAGYFGLEPYRRTYRGLEFSLIREFDKKWEMNASYTWSRSVGTAEGYTQSSLNQSDAGVNQDFDTGSLTHGANGYLPNDRRHQFKVSGRYAFNDQYSLGLTGKLVSGRPISCLGFVPSSLADAGQANAIQPSSFYCLDKNGQAVLHNRGSMGRTPWVSQLDLRLMYEKHLADGSTLALQADIFNVFNQQSTTEVDEFGDTTISVRNPNYGTPVAFSTPRFVRLTVRYDF